jgi:hypothetical protein
MDVDIAVLGGGPGDRIPTKAWAHTALALGPQPDSHDSSTDGRRQVNETCDRCGPAVRALYRVARRGELYLCGHCARQLWPALSAQGWAIWPAGEQPLIANLRLPVEGRPHDIGLDPPRRRQHALLYFLVSHLIRRKSQQAWPSEAAWQGEPEGEGGKEEK